MKENINNFFLSRKGLLIIYLTALACLLIGHFIYNKFTLIGMALLLIQFCWSMFLDTVREGKNNENKNTEADKLFYKILLVLSVVFAVEILVKCVL